MINNLLLSHVSQSMAQFVPPNAPVAVAVSGGADSLALCLLLAQQQVPLVALTVDHLLRPESSAEAEQVHQWLTDRGIEHHTLRWEKSGKPTNLQESARKARYDLLHEWCRAHGFQYLAVAHNQDDQLETLWLRLAHHSGPLGLAGIPDARTDHGLTILRPLLHLQKTEIKQMLKDMGQPWIEDPSNQNLAYTRVQIRQHNLDRNRLLRLQQRAARERMRLEDQANQIISENLTFYPAGYAEIPMHVVDEIIINALLQWISGKEYPVGHASLCRVMEKLPTLTTINCHGCILQRRHDMLMICREAHNISAVTPVTALWDNRFQISLKGPWPNDLVVRKLGDRWREFTNHAPLLALPEPVRPGLPSIWKKEQLLSVPHLAYYGSLDEASNANTLFFPELQLTRSRFIIN